MQTGPDHAKGVVYSDDNRVPHLIYERARRSIGDRIELDREIERRLAMTVFFTYADALAAAGSTIDEGAIVQICVDRLMAQTSVA